MYTYSVLRNAATKVGTKKVGECTSMLWKLREERRGQGLIHDDKGGQLELKSATAAGLAGIVSSRSVEDT